MFLNIAYGGEIQYGTWGFCWMMKAGPQGEAKYQNQNNPQEVCVGRSGKCFDGKVWSFCVPFGEEEYGTLQPPRVTWHPRISATTKFHDL